MPSYQNEERIHYNSRFTKGYGHSRISKSMLDQINEVATKYFFSQVRKYIKQFRSGKILDYGCGTGSKSAHLVSNDWEIQGIDISNNSIEAGKIKFGVNPNITLSVMDCENTSFEDSSFDIIFDFGTFSSIDINRGIKEMTRILRPGGVIICIETLGHNPIANFKRKINLLKGKRTKWATGHIMRVEKWNHLATFFNSCKIKHFNLLPVFLTPLLLVLPAKLNKRLLKFLWKTDSYLLKMPFLQRYAFKTVVVLKK